MSIPIICLDGRLRQFCATFRTCFSQPQFKYLVTVLLALMLCQETHTLSGLVRQIADGQSISGLSRFLSRSPWSAAEVAGAWTKRFHEQLTEAVEREQERQRRQRPKRQGRPQKTVVTGYLMTEGNTERIGDDSTQHKPKGKKMGGLDQYQLMDATAIVRFWTLVMAAYAFLDEERARLREEHHRHVTLGDARREVQRCHWRHVLDWLHQQFSSGVTPDELFPLLAA